MTASDHEQKTQNISWHLFPVLLGRFSRPFVPGFLLSLPFLIVSSLGPMLAVPSLPSIGIVAPPTRHGALNLEPDLDLDASFEDNQILCRLHFSDIFL